MPHRAVQLLTWAGVFVLGIGSSRAANGGPQASFGLEDGYVQVRVYQNDIPAANARIRVFDDVEQCIGDGETDDSGLGSFLPPRRQGCRVGITINGKECDLIPLHLAGTRVEPPRVLLTFGTRPCCRAAVNRRRLPIPRQDRASEEPTPASSAANGLATALAGSFCLTAAGSLLVWFRRSGAPTFPDSPR